MKGLFNLQRDPVDVPLVLSAQVFDIPIVDSKHIIYAPLRRAAFIGNSSVADFIRSLQSGKELRPDCPEDSSLVEFLRALKIIGAGPEAKPMNGWSNPPQPTSLTLFLTTACNLRCRYCYASAGNGNAKFMSVETARRGIDFVAANAVRKGARCFEITFHGGGEPTLHWSVLSESLLYAQRKAADLALRLQASLATNGVLSDEKIDWILANCSGANVSCDGLPSIHDQGRPAASGAGSSSQVLHTLRRFNETGFKYFIRLTLLAEHIPSLPDSIEFLCSDFRPAGIQVEPVYLLGRGNGERTAETDDFIEAFRAAQLRAASHGRRIIFSGARVGSLTNHFCSATQESFCLSADGNVTACHEAFSEDSPLAELFFYGRPIGTVAKLGHPLF